MLRREARGARSDLLLTPRRPAADDHAVSPERLAESKQDAVHAPRPQALSRSDLSVGEACKVGQRKGPVLPGREQTPTLGELLVQCIATDRRLLRRGRPGGSQHSALAIGRGRRLALLGSAAPHGVDRQVARGAQDVGREVLQAPSA